MTAVKTLGLGRCNEGSFITCDNFEAEMEQLDFFSPSPERRELI